LRRLLLPIGVLALTVVLVVGLLQAGDDGGARETAAPPFDLEEALGRLGGAPPPLAALHERSSELVDGGRSAFERRLRTLEGTPVVVNKWASWCGPCRFEMPVFQQVATARGKEIAFLGLNSGDRTPAAERFLREFPVPFPSYEDPDEDIARSLTAPTNYPMTIFLDKRGEIAKVHAGPYRTRRALSADIDRYVRP
jgi:cytochrome c biogenesis protein CcmG/thiol:disulfide interchange protein DsbE